MQGWFVDFEFYQPPGERPRPICMVARAFPSGEVRRYWLWENPPERCPIDFPPGVAYVAYFASAEISCHLALGWEVPRSIIDLYCEFKRERAGIRPRAGHGLLGALAHYGLEGIAAAEKQELRELAIRGGPYKRAEKRALLDYCQTDVDALAPLWEVMRARVDLPRALIRGRYMAAVAAVEACGVPLDAEQHAELVGNWERLKGWLIQETDKDFGVYEDGTFKAERWLGYCYKNKIPWPLLDSGMPDLKRDTFREMAKQYPALQPMKELRYTLSELKLAELSVGKDGRNRYMQSPFRSRTGRNQPSNSRAIFGPSAWIRHLIKPAEGMALAYIDWEQQELGIAAVLSGDEGMMEAYRSGDPYLAFARMAGAVPADATKDSHPVERSIYKVASLAVLMGMGEAALGEQTGTSLAGGRRLITQHQEAFPKFWEWAEGCVDYAGQGGTLRTVFGWQLSGFCPEARANSFRNFGLQANGVEMLRLAVIGITERGIRLCAMVHDAVLIEDTLGRVEKSIQSAREVMAAASRAVLGGFELGTDVEIVRYPDRYRDKRGAKTWEQIQAILGRLK